MTDPMAIYVLILCAATSLGLWTYLALLLMLPRDDERARLVSVQHFPSGAVLIEDKDPEA